MWVFFCVCVQLGMIKKGDLSNTNVAASWLTLVVLDLGDPCPEALV